MPGGFCWFADVSDALQPALSGVGCLWCLPGQGWCCAGAQPPSWLGVLCWCVPPPLVGRAVLVCGPPRGGACCVGLWSPSWWGVLCWCVPPSWLDVLCWCVPPPRSGACCVGLCPTLVVGRAVLVRAPLLKGHAAPVPARRGGVRFGLSSSVWWVVVAVVLLAWPGLVLCWCVPPPLLWLAVFVRGPPPWWGVLCWRVWSSVRGVVAGWIPSWFCWFAVVSAAVRPTFSGVGCLWCLPGRGRCCAGACQPA